MDNIKNALIENVMGQSTYPGVLPIIGLFIMASIMAVLLYNLALLYNMTPTTSVTIGLLFPIVLIFMMVFGGHSNLDNERDRYVSIIRNMNENTRYIYDNGNDIPSGVRQVSGEASVRGLLSKGIPFKFISLSKDKKSVFIEFNNREKSVFEWPVNALFSVNIMHTVVLMRLDVASPPDNTTQARFMDSTY